MHELHRVAQIFEALCFRRGASLAFGVADLDELLRQIFETPCRILGFYGFAEKLGLVEAALEPALVGDGHGHEEDGREFFKNSALLEFGDEDVAYNPSDGAGKRAIAPVFDFPDERFDRRVGIVPESDRVAVPESSRRQKIEKREGAEALKLDKLPVARKEKIENKFIESREKTHEGTMLLYSYTDTLMGLFSSLFNKDSEPSALGIDIGSSAIKIVQIKRQNGRAVLETYGELALGPYGGKTVGQAVLLPPEKIAAGLVDLMKEKEVNITTNKCGLSIPFASSLMSEVEMPNVPPKELATMVPLEARKYIPVPISEVMLDWSLIPKTEVVEDGEAEKPAVSDKVNVLVVAIHNDTIARYQSIVTQAGLDASFFEIEIFSTMRSVLDETLRPVLVIDMGAASTKVYIVERGVVRTSHTVNRGSQDITTTIAQSLGVTPEKAEVMKREAGLLGQDPNLTEVTTLALDYIFSEVNSTMLSFEKKYNKTISKIFLVGGGAVLKGLLDHAKNNLKTEVELGLPFNKVAAPAFLDNILHETGPEFAVAIGLALRKLAEQG